jgi:hypothetical protein
VPESPRHCKFEPRTKRRGGAILRSAAARPDSPGPSGRALGPQEELLAEAVWSLGIPTPPGAIEVRASVDRLVRKQHS